MGTFITFVNYFGTQFVKYSKRSQKGAYILSLPNTRAEKISYK